MMASWEALSASSPSTQGVEPPPFSAGNSAPAGLLIDLDWPLWRGLRRRGRRGGRRRSRRGFRVLGPRGQHDLDAATAALGRVDLGNAVRQIDHHAFAAHHGLALSDHDVAGHRDGIGLQIKHAVLAARGLVLLRDEYIALRFGALDLLRIAALL